MDIVFSNKEETIANVLLGKCNPKNLYRCYNFTIVNYFKNSVN